MQTPNYVVPDHGIGAVRNIPTIDVDEALVTRYLEEAGTKTTDLQVTLLQRGEDFGFYVAYRSSILATMPEMEALEYPELAHIAAAGLTPEVTARAEQLVDGTVSLSLRLPRPGLCIPANEPPTEPWALIDGNGPRTVTYNADAQERNIKERMSLLVRLGFDEAGDVIACLGKGGVGRLDNRTASEITPTLRNLEQRGLIVTVRGYHAPTANGVELTVNLNGVHELGTPSVVSPVPFLPLAEAQRIPEFISGGAAGAACGRTSLASGDPERRANAQPRELPVELAQPAVALVPDDAPEPTDPMTPPPPAPEHPVKPAADAQPVVADAPAASGASTLVAGAPAAPAAPAAAAVVDSPHHPQFKADDDARAAALAAESAPVEPAPAKQPEQELSPAKPTFHPACLTAGAVLVLLIVAGVIAISSQWVGESNALPVAPNGSGYETVNAGVDTHAGSAVQATQAE